MTATPPDAAASTGTFDLMDERLLRDPFTGYSRIREETPMARAMIPGVEPPWVVTRHEDVRAVLGDPRFVTNPASVPGSNGVNLAEMVFRARGVPDEHARYLLANILEFDGADHARLRRLVSRAFTARRVAQLRPRIEEIAEDLLDRLPDAAEGGAVDLLRHFAYPLPIIVICDLVGIPEQDRPRWRRASAALVDPSGAGLAEALADLVDHTRQLIGQRRTEPAEDLITGLIRAQDEDGDRLSDTEMIAMILTLLIAGHETTAHLIGNGTVALLTHPDQLALLRDDPDLMPGAVHELLRWCGPAQATRMRFATEDLRIGDVLVRRGEAVMPILVAANYDPRVFDDPDRLDLTRERDGRGERHVGFAHGLHYCLGAPLARQECEVAFGALLRRFPDLALAVPPDELRRELVPGAWRLAALPVRL
ncbi:cytochrome P450 family protein [Micromonospora sp. NBC_01796]|uniref:cytochrome P450 family protein n=1 Tax=Micromonospora sp. NBC_01796 TaxID=2975987 RepID=UPI002DDB7E0E|nr:cytochrome P450 [Micromonospora sp. NBC_01796]WSA86401.1 cytochrome P450 [Micromonospora sp. NBC_01796]